MLVRRPQATVLRAVHDAYGVVVGRQLVGQLAGAVGRVVVDHEHVHVGLRRAQAADDPDQVVGLVVRRHVHHDPAQGRSVGGGHAGVLSVGVTARGSAASDASVVASVGSADATTA